MPSVRTSRTRRSRTLPSRIGNHADLGANGTRRLRDHLYIRLRTYAFRYRATRLLHLIQRICEVDKDVYF